MMKAYYYSLIETKAGPMVAISDEQKLYSLCFVSHTGVRAILDSFVQKTQVALIEHNKAPMQAIEKELTLYFEGALTTFKTPIAPIGTHFQRSVWEALMGIPVGETRSYSDVAASLGRPTACRAVARANATNPLVIIIPCHRVINKDGTMGGYNCGLEYKNWLLNHESSLSLPKEAK